MYDLCQCKDCLETWGPELGIICPNCGSLNFILTTESITEIIIRDDLQMLSTDRYPQQFCPKTTYEEQEDHGTPIATYGDAKLFIGRKGNPADGGHYVYLYLGKELWMTTRRVERLAHGLSILYEKPLIEGGSRVFVAGLGVGLILLYLALSKHTKEVIVAEIDSDVINLVEPIIRPWLAKNYPAFKWALVHGDALEEVKNHGKFDWIYFDIWKATKPDKSEPTVESTLEAATKHLTEDGRFTNWIEVMADYNLKFQQ